jgi:hypothetical protein
MADRHSSNIGECIQRTGRKNIDGNTEITSPRAGVLGEDQRTQREHRGGYSTGFHGPKPIRTLDHLQTFRISDYLQISRYSIFDCSTGFLRVTRLHHCTCNPELAALAYW